MSGRTRTGIGIGPVRAGQHRQRRKRVVGREREHRNAIERTAGRHQPGGGDETEARLEPHDVAERRRDAAGSRRVGAERERNEAGRDREPRAAARAARDQARIEQIARDAVGRTHAHQAGRELIEIALADHDGAGALEPRHCGRIHSRLVHEGRTGRGGGQALDVDVVLDRDRNAVERTIRVALLHQRPRLRHDLGLRAQRDEYGRVGMGDNARKRPLDRLHRRHGLGAMRPHDVRDGLAQARLPAAGPWWSRRASGRMPAHGLRRGLMRPSLVLPAHARSRRSGRIGCGRVR
jgi:hypothetical protein